MADIASKFFDLQNVVVIGFVTVYYGYLPNSRLKKEVVNKITIVYNEINCDNIVLCFRNNVELGGIML